jgi:hypothetical protein
MLSSRRSWLSSELLWPATERVIQAGGGVTGSVLSSNKRIQVRTPLRGVPPDP